ncbi:hypothetical protein AURDEDRAFT_113849 [Auricularia subglabra TFB-10046 SS5]|nr:hypothetical protein AURDEDRAFT_113849 [Auricularia subglabra TFB-10046 SS5]
MRVAELEGAVVRAAELEVLVGELEAKQDVLMKQLEGGQAVLRKAEAGNVELEDDVRGLQAELARGVTEREELEHRLGRMDDELMMLRARIIDRDTELAGLSGQLHRAKLELEDAQERAAKAIELRGRVDVLEADLKTKDEEAEESYDKLLETMKEKKRLEARVEALTRKVHALQEKLVELQAQPLPPRPVPTTSMSDPQLHVQTTVVDVGGRPRSASGGLETASTPILRPAPPGGPPPTRTASSPAVVFGAPILSRPPSTASTAAPRPPSATVPPLDAMPRLQPRTPSSSNILQRAPSPKVQRAPSGSQQQPPNHSSSRQASSSRQVSGSHPPRAGELRPSASPRSRAGSQEPRPTSPHAAAFEARQRSASTRVPSTDRGRSTTPPASTTLASRRMPTQSTTTVPSPRRPSVAAAAARTDVRSMAAALTSAPPLPAPSSNPRKRPAPEEFDQSLVVGAVPVPVPTSPERPARPPTTSHRRGFTPKRSSAGRPLLAPPSPIAGRFGGDLTNNAAAKDRERPMLGRSWLGKALAAPPAAPQASSAVDSPGFGRVEAMRARFAK